MWIVFAVLSAFFAGVTAVLSKAGIKNVNSNLGTAIRTVVVMIFAWLMVFVAGVQSGITEIGAKTLVLLKELELTAQALLSFRTNRTAAELLFNRCARR